MSTDWSSIAHKNFTDAGIRQVCYVPDAGLTQLIKSCQADNHIDTTSLTTEEEGIALTAGAWLGGQKAVMLMQSSGVGNTINAIASISSACQFPLFMIVTMRGDWGEANPWQMTMGKAVEPVLNAVGVKTVRLSPGDDPDIVISDGLKMAFSSNQSVAVLISQSLIGSKSFIADGGE